MSDTLLVGFVYVVAVMMIVLGAAFMASSIGKTSMLQNVITSCEKHQVFVQDGLIIQCAVVHQAK